jgi:hypothetical protein
MDSFSSKRQIEKWRELVASGKIDQREFDRVHANTDAPHKLPEHVADRRKKKA